MKENIEDIIKGIRKDTIKDTREETREDTRDDTKGGTRGGTQLGCDNWVNPKGQRATLYPQILSYTTHRNTSPLP
jgi:hypothetical protein